MVKYYNILSKSIERLKSRINNKVMKNYQKIFFIILIICLNFTATGYCEEQSGSTQNIPATEAEQDDIFAPVDLDLTDYSQMNKKNKKFELQISKEESPKYVKNTGQAWSEDKLFLYNYYSDESNLRVLPSYGSLNSYLTRELDDNTSVMIGQDGISSINGDTVNFAYANSSYYSSGARLDRQGKYMNYSVGAFNETDTQNQELAAIVSTKPTSILNSKGKFYVEGGVFSNLMNDVNKNTSGMFAQYKNDKWSLGAQLARSEYTQSGYQNSSSAHFLSTYKVNDHLSLKNKIVKNFDIDELQGEIGITYSPLKDTDRLKFELTAANYQSSNIITRQRLKFSTSFKF